MAKNQNLALNQNKVSGGCGRLLCCLTYENDAYTDLRRRLPPLRTRVRMLPDGDTGNIVKTDILNQMVIFETADGRLLTAKVTEVEVLERSKEVPRDAADSEADVWAEGIDLDLLMGDGGQKPAQYCQNQRQDRNRSNQGQNRNRSNQGPKTSDQRTEKRSDDNSRTNGNPNDPNNPNKK